MISFQAVTKKFGANTALSNFTTQIKPGEIVGFLGPNGAGKTTAMRLLTGFLLPTEGKIMIDEEPLLSNLIKVKKRLGYLPEHNPLYADQKVSEYLEFVADIRLLPKNKGRQAIKHTLEVCGLTQVVNQTIGTLSKGFRQRVGLAQALIHNPDILILDEPTSGLDPNQIVEIRNLIRTIGQEKTVILSTHILPEVSAVCDRAIILNKGQLVAEGSLRELESRVSGERIIEITLRAEEGAFAPTLSEISGVTAVEKKQSNGEEVSYSIHSNRDVRDEIFSKALEKHVKLLQLNEKKASLEEVFHELTMEER